MQIFVIKLELLVFACEYQSQVNVETMVKDAVVRCKLVVLAVVALRVSFLVLGVPLRHQFNAF